MDFEDERSKWYSLILGVDISVTLDGTITG